jgi:antitoxin PrlF
MNLINLISRKGGEVIKHGKKVTRKESCSTTSLGRMGCCKVEAVVTIDERGQMVLPKEIRDKAKIRAGDKLAVVNWERDGEVCCISLIRVENLTKMVSEMLGPLMKGTDLQEGS